MEELEEGHCSLESKVENGVKRSWKGEDGQTTQGLWLMLGFGALS